jgi:hypothetical protein
VANENKHEGAAQVGILMGSDTDYPVMSEAAKTLEKFGIPYELEVVSAHRTPARAHEYATTASQRGLKVLIASCRGDRRKYHSSCDWGSDGNKHAQRTGCVAIDGANARRDSRRYDGN